ncbi:hypothetical protein ETU08_00890 [Apibacter muscae]|uniref:C1q domain-containing protein n=1 Tax=Apibacter muscae TaxID=2509004 RepID=A0A563DK59_9FLAO|nr:hypothetical protein [Apibacter muscae]TWP30489.1 hypothetical protein ETU09_00375 [Apibacter muscae]TWP31376.1 hypothetical protein ETU08_00890 [Apibacter muscae]
MIIDNENTYTSNASGNSFTVKEQGIYFIALNFLIQNTVQNTLPVIGIWDDTDGKWIARINDVFVVESGFSTRNQSFTLITSTELLPSHIYSFRVSNTSPLTIASTSSGSTGSGAVSTALVQRLR